MAAESRATARRVTAAVCWAAAAHVLLRAGAFYLHIGGTRRHHIEAASFAFIATLVALAIIDRGRRPHGSEASLPQRTDGAWRQAAAAGGFVAASLLLYFPVLSTGLFADDFVILDAASSGRYTVWRELFRPAIFVLWRAASRLPVHTPVVLHAINVVLHGINAFLVSRLAFHLRLPQWGAIASGLLFLCYPASVEAIAWPSGVQDVLMATCVLAIAVLGTSTARLAWRGGLAIAALALGLMTKETAVAAPVLLVIAGIVRPVRRSTWTTAAICGAVVALFLAVRFSVLPMPNRPSGGGPARYTVKELLVRPFATLVAPFREEEMGEHPALPLAAVTLVLCSVAAAFTRNSGGMRPTAFAGAGIVLAAVAPVFTFFFIDPNLLGSRYVYLASAGWAVLLAALAHDATARPPVAAALAACWIAMWTPFALSHERPWHAAAIERERILSAAAQAADERCAAWAVYGLPSVVDGVPLFINGFPEAARPMLGRVVRIAPPDTVDGECRLTWTGSGFKRD